MISIYSKAWLAWTTLAVVGWGLWAILSREIGDSLSPAQSQALSTLGLLPLVLLLRPRFVEAFATASSKRTGIIQAFAAGLVTCLGNTAYYAVLNQGGKVSVVIPLTSLYPLVTVVLAVLLLHEKLSLSQRLGIGFALLSITLFNISSTDGMWGSSLVYALPPIVLWGVAGLLQKMATNHVSGEDSAFWFLLAFVPVGLVLLALGLPSLISIKTWTLVIFLGFTFALGNFALLRAFASGGKASVVAPAAGLYPLVSLPIAYFAYGERLGTRELLGITCSLIAVAAMAIENTKQTLEPPK